MRSRANNISISSTASEGYGDDADIDDDLSMGDGGLMIVMDQFPEKPSILATSKKDTTIRRGRPSLGKKRKKGKRKPKDYPKRPLSTYNIFFKETRGKILKEHGKTNFQEMVHKIAALWKEITPEDKANSEALALKDLARYKEEVGIYEQNVVGNNRLVEKKRKRSKKSHANNEQIATISSDPPYVAIDTKSDHEKNDDGERTNFPVKNVRVPNIVHDASIAETSPELPTSCKISLTLTSTELQLAHRHLEDELVPIDDAISLQKRQSEMYGNSSTATLPASGINGAKNPAGINLIPAELEIQRRRIAEIRKCVALGFDELGGKYFPINTESGTREFVAGLTGDARVTFNKIESRNRLGFDMDTIATDNALKMKKRIADFDSGIVAASKELELRKQLRKQFILRNNSIAPLSQAKKVGGAQKRLKLEAELRFASSNFSGERDSMSAFIRELELTNGVMGNQMLASREAEIRNGLSVGKNLTIFSSEAEIRKRTLIANVESQLSASDAGLRKRLAMLRSKELCCHFGSRATGIDSVYKEILLREQTFHQQKLLMARPSGGTPPSLYGAPSRADLLAIGLIDDQLQARYPYA